VSPEPGDFELSGIALAIVLASAFLHAGWNYLLKKSDRKIVFTWWFLLLSVVIYFPVFLYYFPEAPIPAKGWLCIAATGILHAVYFWFMGGAYQRGDLSLVYPLARGSGPLFVPVLAVILLGEKIALLGGIGILLIIGGVIKMIPLTGVTLPFVSYGGSALIVNLIGVGVLLFAWKGVKWQERIGLRRLFAIYNPFDTYAAAGGRILRRPYPGNAVPASMAWTTRCSSSGP